MLDLTIAAPQRHENLRLFPLTAEPQAELPYVLLADALDAGTLRITEIGSGSVPALLATNLGETDVLLLDGEQLIGAKQNRITNRSLILGAGTETKIPVTCIGSQGLYARLHGRFLGGYAMDALAHAGEDEGRAEGPAGQGCGRASSGSEGSRADNVPAAAPDDAARVFVGFVSAAERAEASTVGKGTYRVLSGPVVGGELEDPRPVHLSAFPSPDSRGRTSGGSSPSVHENPIASPSRRRGWRSR